MSSGLRHEDSAAHAHGLADRQEACRRMLHSGESPHHVAHFTTGVRDFDMDVLGGERPDDVRAACLQTERKLSLLAGGIDRMLEEVRTGSLIRTVLQAERGACFCDSIVPLEYLAGVRIEPIPPTRGEPVATIPGVRSADIALAQLVTLLREQLSLDTQNPGGWSTRKPEQHTPQPAVSTQDRSPADRSAVNVRGDSPYAALCRAAVDVKDLHYVAHCRQGALLFAADRLDHDRLTPFFTQIGVDERRDFYDGFGEGFGVLANRLSRMCVPSIGGKLHRIVLDVQQGAIFYYRLDIGEYLFGVTLDQARVSDADDKLSQLVVDCQSRRG